MSAIPRRTLLSSGVVAAAACTVPAFLRRAMAAPPEENRSMTIEHRTFGKTGLSVAVLGFGGSEIGYERTDDATVARLLNAALDAGLNVVDTAECYINSEEQIARAIGHRRNEFHLFTKVGHWIPEGKDESWGWTKEGVLASIDRSLKRLKTDHVELVQIHSCDIDELKLGCVEGLQEAKKQGKTRFIGYSGDREDALHAVNMDVFDALQTSVNIADQQCVELFLPQAKAKNLGVIAKRPIANAAWRYDATPDQSYHVEYWNRLQKLKYPFASGDARNVQGPDGPVGTALRFTLQQPGVHVAIVGTSKPERWSQNAALTQAGPLKPEQLKAIRDRWKEVAPADWGGMT